MNITRDGKKQNVYTELSKYQTTHNKMKRKKNLNNGTVATTINNNNK